MPQRIERRWLGDYKVPKIEIRAADDGSKLITGHGAVFNKSSQNLGGFVEQVATSAFNKTMGEADIRALVNHDANILLGRNQNDTLDLTTDDVGLRYDITPPDTSAARDWLVLLERGDISQSSFSFRAIDVDWGIDENDVPLRTLKEVALYDVGPVTFPAYLDADSGIGGSGRAALMDLAERRSVKFEEVVELATHGELRDLIKDGLKQPVKHKDKLIVTTRSGEPTADEQRAAAKERAEARDIDPVPGSYESVSEALQDAIEAWAAGQTLSSWYYVYIDATFPDRVVASLYGGAWDYDGETFQFDYSIDADGAVTLGEPSKVQLTMIILPAEPGDRSKPDNAEKRTSLTVHKARLRLRERQEHLPA